MVTLLLHLSAVTNQVQFVNSKPLNTECCVINTMPCIIDPVLLKRTLTHNNVRTYRHCVIYCTHARQYKTLLYFISHEKTTATAAINIMFIT